MAVGATVRKVSHRVRTHRCNGAVLTSKQNNGNHNAQLPNAVPELKDGKGPPPVLPTDAADTSCKLLF